MTEKVVVEPSKSRSSPLSDDATASEREESKQSGVSSDLPKLETEKLLPKRLQFVRSGKIDALIERCLEAVDDCDNEDSTESCKDKVKGIASKDALYLDEMKYLVQLANSRLSHDSSENGRVFMHELLSGEKVHIDEVSLRKDPNFAKHLEQLRKRQAQASYTKMLARGSQPLRYGAKGKGFFTQTIGTLSDPRLAKKREKEEGMAVAFANVSKSLNLLMVLIGSFLVFYYMSDHFLQRGPHFNIISGCVGLILGALLDVVIVIFLDETKGTRERLMEKGIIPTAESIVLRQYRRRKAAARKKELAEREAKRQMDDGSKLKTS